MQQGTRQQKRSALSVLSYILVGLLFVVVLASLFLIPEFLDGVKVRAYDG